MSSEPAKFAHSREEVRAAKARLLERIGGNPAISVGIGWTEARDDYALTVTVAKETDARRLPRDVDGVPIRISISGRFNAY